jgi:hypothetical protein
MKVICAAAVLAIAAIALQGCGGGGSTTAAPGSTTAGPSGNDTNGTKNKTSAGPASTYSICPSGYCRCQACHDVSNRWWNGECLNGRYCVRCIGCYGENLQGVVNTTMSIEELATADKAPEQGWISMLAVAVSAGAAGAFGMFMVLQARQRSSPPPLVEEKQQATPDPIRSLWQPPLSVEGDCHEGTSTLGPA